MKVGDLVIYTDDCCRRYSVITDKVREYYGIGVVLFIDDVDTLRIRRNEIATVHVHWTKRGDEWEPYDDLEIISESR